MDVTTLSQQSLEEQELVCEKICNIVTRHGAYRLTLPVKTWQANLAILSALENMERQLEQQKQNIILEGTSAV